MHASIGAKDAWNINPERSLSVRDRSGRRRRNRGSSLSFKKPLSGLSTPKPGPDRIEYQLWRNLAVPFAGGGQHRLSIEAKRTLRTNKIWKARYKVPDLLPIKLPYP